MDRMKRTPTASSKSTSRRKTKPRRNSAPATIDEYLEKIPPLAQDTLARMRAAIRSASPRDAVETISYGIPAFRTSKGVLVWFAAFPSHYSLFPTARVIEAFKSELKGLSTSKGTIHFPSDKPLPIPLIKKIVKARAEQLENKKRS
jgi:uncharacterized protein YdhG (YjbR/CyaY superfamily)